MKIIINKQAEKALKRIKKNLACSDSTAILVLYELSSAAVNRLGR